MGVRRFNTYTSADTTLTTTAEAVVATLSGVSTNQPGQTVALRGSYRVVTGAGTTALTGRIREDSLTGTVVGDAGAVQIEAAAGSTEDHDVYVESQAPGEFSGKTYVLTVQQTGATGNGTVQAAGLEAEVTP
jgi:hypothetical protein